MQNITSFWGHLYHRHPSGALPLDPNEGLPSHRLLGERPSQILDPPLLYDECYRWWRRRGRRDGFDDGLNDGDLRTGLGRPSATDLLGRRRRHCLMLARRLSAHTAPSYSTITFHQ